MISLFLVEDERFARESIRDNVPWQEHDILFLGDAPDGEVALPQLLEKRPDILLTDIKMPFMDGLELARIVRKELPDTRIIILSGHNEFEYARKAITLGVNDYLLKPVSSRDILEAVDRSKAQILECRARRIERQSHSITQRELFFSNLYSGILMGPAQMLQRAAQLGISLAAGAYQIILTELDGVVYSLIMLSGYPLHAVSMEMDAIASSVIGGTLMSGGVAFLPGTLLGVLIQGVIQTFITFQGTLSAWWTRIIIALLLCLFIVIQAVVSRSRQRLNSEH